MSSQYESSNVEEQTNSSETGFYLNTWGIAWRCVGLVALVFFGALHMLLANHLVEEGVVEPEFQRVVGFGVTTLATLVMMIIGGEVVHAVRRVLVDRTGKSRALYGGLAAVTAIGLYVGMNPASGVEGGQFVEASRSLWLAASIMISFGWVEGAIYEGDGDWLRNRVNKVLD